MHILTVLPFFVPWLTLAAAESFPYDESCPEPRQPGWDRNCRQWVKAQPGDTCYDFAQLIRKNVLVFIDRNPQLHDDCRHSLWAGYWYCLGYDEPTPGAVQPATSSIKPFDGISFDVLTTATNTRPPVPTPNQPA
ncbi:hypothetical protein GE09DRAFT_1048185 [Coniochaeta sp. 2T2.1]|nr:hypothetical protein GE09DRAFT_1048185 [Coniochaeta sp. 2T2.1]